MHNVIIFFYFITLGGVTAPIVPSGSAPDEFYCNRKKKNDMHCEYTTRAICVI